MVLDLAHRLHPFCKDRSCWLLLLWGWHGQHDDWQTVIYYFALVQTRLGKSQIWPFWFLRVIVVCVCVCACMHAWGSCWSEAHAGNLFTPARTLSKFRQPMAVSAMTELLAASASDFEILAVSANVFFAVIQWIPKVFFFLLLLLLVLVGISWSISAAFLFCPFAFPFACAFPLDFGFDLGFGVAFEFCGLAEWNGFSFRVNQFTFEMIFTASSPYAACHKSRKAHAPSIVAL